MVEEQRLADRSQEVVVLGSDCFYDPFEHNEADWAAGLFVEQGDGCQQFVAGRTRRCGLLGDRFGLGADVVSQRDGRWNHEFADVTKMSLLATSPTAQHWSRRLDFADRLAKQQAMSNDVEPLVQAFEAAL